MENSELHNKLIEELDEIKAQLEEANDTIEAIRSGQIDALVVNGKNGHQLFTLKSTDQTYRIFIEQMTESAITLDGNYKILYTNSQFAKLLQLPLEKVIGQSFIRFIRPQDIAYAEKLIKQAWKTSVKGELQLVREKGNVIPVLVSLTTLELDEGPSMSIIITDLTSLKETQRILELKNKQLQDSQRDIQNLNNNLEKTVNLRTSELEFNIAGRIKVEDELRVNEARLTSILQTMGEGLCILNNNGHITFANAMAKKLFELTENEILSRDFFSMQGECFSMDGKILTRHQHPIAELIVSLKPIYDQEILIRNNKEENVYISINASPLVDNKGDLDSIVATFIDVTNKRKIALQKDEFISVASHELKTPLTSLKASMQLLSRVMEGDKTSEKIPKIMEMANINLTKVVRLTEDLMNVSKIQHGPLPLNKEEIKLIDLIRDCGNQIIDGKPIELRLSGDLQAKVYADKQKVEQVIINLFNNAIKYAPESKRIDVKIETFKKIKKVSVQDFGNGIANDKIENLFDRYYQVDPSGKQVSGLGLGLYISSEIIRRHGGTMSVESKLGEGSTFTFTLPSIDNVNQGR